MDHSFEAHIPSRKIPSVSWLPDDFLWYQRI